MEKKDIILGSSLIICNDSMIAGRKEQPVAYLSVEAQS